MAVKYLEQAARIVRVNAPFKPVKYQYYWPIIIADPVDIEKITIRQLQPLPSGYQRRATPEQYWPYGLQMWAW